MSFAETMFILVLVVAGAAIAWVGDWIGFRLGKKRVSLFGIRPRTTAVIIGSLFGALISALTIFVLAATSEEYRTALFYTEELRAERDELADERDDLLSERAALRGQVADAQRAAETAETKLGELQGSIEERESRLEQLRAQLGERQRRLAEVRRLLSRSQGENKELQAEAEQLEAEIEQLDGDIEQAERNLTQAVARLRAVRQDYAQYRLDEASREYGAPPPVEAGHEFVRDVMDLTQPAEQVRAKILELLGRASDEALLMGAEVGDNGRAVRLYAVKAETEVPTPEPEVPEPQVIEAVVESLMALEEKSQVIGVVALFPAWEGQQVLVGLPHRWNKLVFLEGEVVASQEIDGSQTRADLYRALSILLIGSVRPEAERRRMLYRPNTKEIGRVSVDEIFDAIEELKRENRPMRVEAVVERDTWTIGPLNLDLRIVPPEEE